MQSYQFNALCTGYSISSDSWVRLTLILAELAEQLGKMVQHHRSTSIQSNPTQPSYRRRCIYVMSVPALKHCLIQFLKAVFRLNNNAYILRSLRGGDLLPVVGLADSECEDNYGTMILEQKRLYSHSWQRVIQVRTWEGNMT